MDSVIVGQQAPCPSWRGFAGVLNQALGSTYTIDCEGYNGIGFHLVPPTDGTVLFEGSFDDTNWTPITYRQIGADGYTQKVSTTEDFIGSIACLKAIRFRVTVGGSAPGAVGGRMTVPSNVLEGIEHGNASHCIGYTVQAKTISINTAGTDQPIWIPSPGKKPVISDIHFTVDGNSTVTISDGPIVTGDYLVKGTFKSVAGQSQFVPVSFRLPHVSHHNGTIYISQSDASAISGVMHGYEIDT